MGAPALARSRYLTADLSPDEQHPLPYDATILDSLPGEIKAATGAVLSVSPLSPGACNLLLKVEAERGASVLKVAQGEYRSQELWAEHTAMQLLYGGLVPVPRSLAYARRGDLSYHLRAYCPGMPSTSLLERGGDRRLDAIAHLGILLAKIHAASVGECGTWEDWIESSLERAERNVAAGVCDPDEFTPDQPPERLLGYLRSNRPVQAGPICLLHGDYRPKNVLWHSGDVSGIIDWQFVDVGDPYMRDEAEWRAFLGAYGSSELDRERFGFCSLLQKLLNV
jgi:aminoglycoside phosphotransferase (APT) family kinase protein